MRKQSIINRRYMDRLKKTDPAHAQEIRRRKQFSAAKSFVKLHSRLDELDELHQVAKKRRQEIKNTQKNS